MLAADVWDLLKKILPEHWMPDIDRITQVDRRIRFEVSHASSLRRSLRRALISVASGFGWRIRSSADRPESRLARFNRAILNKFPVPASGESLSLASLNVNGIANKKASLEDYLFSDKIDILGLQETRNPVYNWNLKFEGYNTFEVRSTEGVGQRGLAIVITKKLSCYVVGERSQYFIFVRVFGAGTITPFIIGVVYLPHRHATLVTAADAQHNPHSMARDSLCEEALTLHNKFTTDPLILMGDFNASVEEMVSLKRRLPFLKLKIMRGDNTTFSRPGVPGRGLDHFWISKDYSDLLKNPYVDRTLDVSDHWPIRGQLHLRLKAAAHPEVATARTRWSCPINTTANKLRVSTNNAFGIHDNGNQCFVQARHTRFGAAGEILP